MVTLKAAWRSIIRPIHGPNVWADLLLTIPRFVTGMLLTIEYGSSKFGLPWSSGDNELALFEVASWFPEDVASYGPPFVWAPWLFAWLGAASEAIGGAFLAAGLGTRVASFFILCTMLVAIFCAKWGGGSWGMLPAMGFLWVSFFYLVFGSGRFGLDNLLSTKRNN